MYATLHIKPGRVPRLISTWDGFEDTRVERELGVPSLDFQATPGEEVIGAIRSRRAVARILAKRGLPPHYIELRSRWFGPGLLDR